MTDPQQQQQSIPGPVTDGPVCYRVSNVDPRATAADLEEHFNVFGQLRYVKVQHAVATQTTPGPSDRSLGEAFICFEDFPSSLLDPSTYRKAAKFMNRQLQFDPTDIKDVIDMQSLKVDYKSVYQRRALSATDPSHHRDRSTDRAHHDRDESFDVSAIEIGSFIGSKTLYMPYTVQCKDSTWIYLEFSLQHKKIRWIVVDTVANQEFKFEIHFRDLYELISIEADLNAQVYWVTLDLMVPPKLYAGKCEFTEDVGMWEWTRKFGLVWHRVIKVDPCAHIDFGQNLAFRFQVPSASSGKFVKTMMLLNERGMIANPSNFEPFLNIVYDLPGTTFIDYQQDLTKLYNLKFSTYYALLSLITNGLLSKYLVSPEFVACLAETDAESARGAFDIMMQSKRRVYDPLQEFQRTLRMVPAKMKNKIPEHCTLMRKIVITPTRIIFNPESIELGNRVLRHFEQYSDRFIRVSFADENFSKYLDGTRISESVHNRLRDILFSGIPCADRIYSFLAFSSSQLRDHSCWFFADCVDSNGEHLTSERIRKWMGNFDHIRSVAKYAARLGQCFSSTTPVDVSSCTVTEIPDVERNGYCFSDGVGKISHQMAQKIARDMKLESVPSAFQVRMSGYKGVLSVDPSIQEDEPPVQFRPSMKKFTTSHQSSLDIIRPSQYSPAFLNHQIITLLSSMQIKDDVFLKLQEQMQKDLDALLSSRNLALSLLAPLAVEGYVMGILLKMIASGMPLTKDPFISNSLQLFQCCKMKEVKYKARIHVPKGVQLVGVLDETKVLKYGQIFVQYTDPLNTSRLNIVKGTVLMAKMPAVHPGDVRILQCVDKPALHHYHDVVVFPQNGARPHPNEASGSDLDGDIYFITWDPRLIPIIRNYRPLEYDAPSPHALDRDVNINDIKNFMVDYMKGDNLGLIATSHKIHADLSVKGVLSQKCIELAQLHSIAVDFPKTGIPADYNPQKYSVRTFPDFLGRSDSRSYESNKALGLLYRAAKLKPYRPVRETEVNNIFTVDGFEAYVSEALVLKQQFDFEIRKIMSQFGIRSELEVVTQLILDMNRFNSRKEFEMKRSLNSLLKALSQKYRSEFWRNVGKEDNENGKIVWNPVYSDESMKKASAWYQVSYDPKFQKPVSNLPQKSDRQILIAFPWLTAFEVLIKLFLSRNSPTGVTTEAKSLQTNNNSNNNRINKALPDRKEGSRAAETYEEMIDGRRFLAGFEVMAIQEEGKLWENGDALK